MQLLFPYLTYAFFAYVALTAVYIVSENRRPRATFAWMFLFWAVPAVGLVIYILFGRRQPNFGRTRTLLRQDLPGHLGETLERLRRHHESALERLDARRYPSAKLARMVHNNAHSHVTLGNEVDVLQDAAQTYPRMFEDMRRARSSIHLQYFSWSSDELGQELKDLLAGKAKEGVEVRLLYDPVGSFGMLSPFYVRAMRKNGVDMRPFSPLWRVHTLSYRNHRKIAVIDGEVGFTGGLNIGHEHVDPGPGFDLWRDTHLRVTGPAVAVLQAVFAVDWANAAREDLLEPGYFPPLPPAWNPKSGVPVQICLSGPDSEWRAVRQQYFEMIVGARDRVRVQTPFFILDATIAEALKAAALAGVRVEVMVSERGMRQTVPIWAANTYMAEVAEAGVRVLLYEPGYLHAKTVTVDGEVCSIGSANWDIRSFAINYELNAVIYDSSVAAELNRAFDHDATRCRAFDPQAYRQSPWPLRFRDSLARLASPLL